MHLAESLEHRTPSDQRHPWEQVRLEFISSLIRKNITLRDGSSVIDIGCGDAYVTEHLAAQYPNCTFYAVDIAFTDSIIQHLKDVIPQKNIVYTSSTTAIAQHFKDSAPSLIILMDVIEHVADDGQLLTDIRLQGLCPPTTNVLITVPAFELLNSSRDVSLGHYRRYTNTSLRNLLTSNAYQVKKIGYFFLTLLILRLMKVIGEKIFGVKESEEKRYLVWDAHPLITAIVLTILRADVFFALLLRMIGINCIGLSNYCICSQRRNK